MANDPTLHAAVLQDVQAAIARHRRHATAMIGPLLAIIGAIAFFPATRHPRGAEELGAVMMVASIILCSTAVIGTFFALVRQARADTVLATLRERPQEIVSLAPGRRRLGRAVYDVVLVRAHGDELAVPSSDTGALIARLRAVCPSAA